MDFTLEDMEAVQSCLEGIDRNVHLAVERAAARLLRIRSISGIACVPEIILGLASGEITRERSDPAVQARNCPLRHLTQTGLELAKRHLDRVQIGEYCGR